MNIPSDNQSLKQTQDQAGATESDATRRAYIPPRLTEYGSFTKLTASGIGGSGDPGGRTVVCL
jgi:hypothetical protein